jgi:hypothetical protein
MTHAFTFREVEGLVRSTPATGGFATEFPHQRRMALPGDGRIAPNSQA